jgi:hypothetical protein
VVVRRISPGIPQGTILGSLLFSRLVNDTCRCFSSKYGIFAEDLKLYRSLTGHNDIVLCNLIDKWCSNNNILLNVDKCQPINFNRKMIRPSISNYTLNIMQ